MSAAIPHDHVRETQDRSWTARLVEAARAVSTAPEDRADAFATLIALSDHRSVQPLLSMLEDHGLDDDVRQSAADALNEIDDTSTASQRASWWDSGDEILMDHALGQMGRFEAEVVAGRQ